MRRADLHPDLQRVLRGVERDIDARTVTALMKYGHTEQTARAYLARRDLAPLRGAMQRAVDSTVEVWAVVRRSVESAWEALRKALGPLQVLAESPQFAATVEAQGWNPLQEGADAIASQRLGGVE